MTPLYRIDTASASPQHATVTTFPSPVEEISDDQYRITPWDSNICTRCVFDSDCPGPLTICGFDSCCIDKKCYDDTDCGKEADAAFYTVKGVNAESSNLNPLQPFDDPQNAAVECLNSSECVAYNSLGYMKDWLPPPSLWQLKPMVEGLPDWALYLKKTVVDDPNDNRIQLKHGIRTFCKFQGTDVDNTPYGMCASCIECQQDDDCPINDLCANNCCVNNPCLTADVYNDEWVNIRYDRDPQCNCPPDKPHCCLANKNDTRSFFCSDKPCWKQQRLPACAYMCEDSFEKFLPQMCNANQRCCNANDDFPPVCCTMGTNCGTDETGANICVNAPAFLCGGDDDTPAVTCVPSSICCNDIPTSPGKCCDPETEQCDTEHGGNVCRYVGDENTRNQQVV